MARLSFSLITLFLCAIVNAQQTIRYYSENDGLTQSHVTQMLQDSDGFIWIATWNGLNRFDGYEFRSFKTRPGDGCNMPTDRLRNIMLSNDGNIWCQADENIFLFDTKTGQFHETTPSQTDSVVHLLAAKSATRSVKGPIAIGEHIIQDAKRRFTDRQGNLWLIGNAGLYHIIEHRTPGTHIDTDGHAVKSIGHNTIATDDGTILSIDSAQSPTPLWHGPSAYCLTNDKRDNTLWVGTKPDGIYHLGASGTYHISQANSNLSNNNIYDMDFDSQGRLWIATLGGGLNCMTSDGEISNSQSGLKGYPSHINKVRHITIYGDTLIASTTDGLLIANIANDNLDSIVFRHHQRDPNRTNSLAANATMMTLIDSHHRLVVCTESGGVNISTTPLSATQLDFQHFDQTTGMPTDIAQSAFEDNGALWIVSSNKIVRLDPQNNDIQSFGAHFWQRDCHFTEAIPTQMDNGQWIVGLADGAITIATNDMHHSDFCPNIVLTSLSIQGEEVNYQANSINSLTLTPSQRNISISFAALDFGGMENVRYAFRLAPDAPWNYTDAHTATFIDMKPGDYRLQIRSTNADGEWVDNIREIRISVKPRFVETPIFTLLLVLLTIAIGAIVTYTVMFIKRIDKERRETLEAYLNMLDDQSKKEEAVANERRKAQKILSQANNDEMMQKVLAFINDNLSNSDIKIEDMASAAATSKSVLARKTKEFFGLTPSDLLKEARIQKACALLRDPKINIIDVALTCGFSDSKYFAKCFKSSVGQTPTQYRSTTIGETN